MKLNNCISGIIAILLFAGFAYAQADLTITDVFFKEQGNSVQITANVKNLRDVDVKSSEINFYSNGSIIGSQSKIKLKKNQTKKVSVKWNTSNLDAGEYQIKVEISNVSPDESNLSNNSFTSSYTIEGQEQEPDLSIISLSLKSQGSNSQIITIIADVKNIGEGDAESYKVVFTANGNHLSTKNLSSLNTNKTKKVTTDWNISNLAGGDYSIKAEVTNVSPAESNSSNNTSETTYTIENLKPDLTVINLSFKTTRNNPRDVQITADVKNIGKRDAESYSVDFYANEQLFASKNLGKLRKNQGKKVTTNWEIINNEAGDYTIKAEVVNVKPEDENTSNNSYSSSYTIESREPDLTLSDISFKETGFDGKVTLQVDVSNIGPGDAASYAVSFYYSYLDLNEPANVITTENSTSVFSDGTLFEISPDTILIYKYDGKNLKANNSKKLQTIWNYSGLLSGECNIIAVINDVVPDESDTTNNITLGNYIIPCPDLYVSDVKFTPGEGIAKIDHHTTINAKIKNFGKISSNSCKVGFYYDLTPENENDDPNLSDPIGGSLIDIKKVNSGDRPVTPVHVLWEPIDLLPETVYPVYIIISDANPEECDTTNNIYITSYYFQESSGDSTDPEQSFSLLTPAIDAILSDTTVTFSWEALICDSSKKDTSDVFYTLFVDTDSLFSNPIIIDNIAETEYFLDELQNEMTYFWKVRATNCRGKWIWSNELNWYFTVDLSYGFSLISPVKDDTVKSLTPSFSWETFTLPENESAIYYALYYSTDINFVDAVIIDSLTTNEFTLNKPLADSSIYYWKVNAFDTSGNVVWNKELDWYFYVQNSINNSPQRFSLLSPTNGDDVFSLFPEFQWQSSVEIDTSDSVYYVLYYSTDGSFTNPIVVDSLLETKYIPPAPLLDSTKYYWKIKAVDTKGAETWSNQTDWSFTVLDVEYVKLELSDAQVNAGEIFVISLLLDNISGGELPIYGFQINLQYDPSKLTFMDGVLTERTSELPIMIMPNSPTISLMLINNSPLNITPGTGSIIELQFLALDNSDLLTDTTEINFSSAQLFDSEQTLVQSLTIDSEISIKKTILYGDLNNDGILDISDISLLIDIMLGNVEPTSFQLTVGDMNSDGNIDLVDLKELANLVRFPFLALKKILAQFEMKKIPEEFGLNQNYPNPFNSTTSIQFSIPENSFVTINVYNVFGQLVKTIINKSMTKGYHSIKWDGTSNEGNIAASGIYYYIMKANNFSERKTMTLLK